MLALAYIHRFSYLKRPDPSPVLLTNKGKSDHKDHWIDAAG